MLTDLAATKYKFQLHQSIVTLFLNPINIGTIAPHTYTYIDTRCRFNSTINKILRTASKQANEWSAIIKTGYSIKKQRVV